MYILVLIDHFSRWAEPIPLRKTEVADVVHCLKEIWMPKHGVPAILLSDNGPQFAAGCLEISVPALGLGKSTVYRITHKGIRL